MFTRFDQNVGMTDKQKTDTCTLSKALLNVRMLKIKSNNNSNIEENNRVIEHAYAFMSFDKSLINYTIY